MRMATTTTLKLVSSPPKVADEKSHTELSLETIESARSMILRAEKEGKPCTHVVITLASVYRQGTEDRMVTQSVSSCDDLTAVGLMHLASQDMFQ
jgi:hypothetical protein